MKPPLFSEVNKSYCVNVLLFPQYSGVNIGPVHKRDIMKCSTMLEHDGQYVHFLASFSFMLNSRMRRVAIDGFCIISSDRAVHRILSRWMTVEKD